MPTSKSGADSAASDIDTLTLGLAPAVAAASVYSSLAQSTGILYENAVAQQQRQAAAADLLAFGGVLSLLALPAAGLKRTVAAADPDAELARLLKALKELN